MNFFELNRHYILLFIFSIFLIACSNNDRQNDSDDLSDNNTVYDENQLQQDNAQVDKNFAAYTYIVEPEDVPVPVVKAEEKEEINNNPKTVKTTNRSIDEPNKLKQPELEVEFTDEEEVPQVQVDLDALADKMTVNRPPIFSKNCLTVDRPAKCSNESIENYVQNNLDFPDDANKFGDDGIEHVIFRVTKDGTVEDIKVRSRNNPCIGCARAARDVIASTSGQWLPAMRNGKAVNTKVTLSVHFDL